MSSMPFRILAVAAVAVLIGAAPASAQYFMSKPLAERFALSDVTARYVGLDFGDDANVHIDCRPSRYTKFNRTSGNKFHRWVCDWQGHTMTDTSCSGRMVIGGSSADVNNSYRQATLVGARCTVKGLQQYGGLLGG